ncbi:ABC transporter transmembrane domain-containing protein [Anaerobacillus alkalilacustris]|uniref:ABC transporter transmembrane domain-containing protein n=1 Tax=Anaerobacillus alkalilacustris TaxID=393763 RepID=UPI001FE161E2|nr:ABC transporter ATP-binding protein [Anaerobacillus alkalilacustris]
MGKIDESQLLNFESIFMETKEKPHHSLKTLSLLYQGQFKNLFLSFFFFIIKHSPVWVIPVITANIINIVTYSQVHSLKELWVQFAIVAVVIAQNIPTHILHISYFSKASRHVEAALRSTLIRKLQHLSMSFHSELRSGMLQAKILRDVENIEILSKQMMFSFSAAITNVVVAISITAFYSLQMTLFFLLVVPVGIVVVFIFRRALRLRNREFRKQIEMMSGEVAETVDMIPVTRAHGLQHVEMNKANRMLKILKGKGYRLDVTEAFFGSSSWVVFQVLQMLCLLFSAFMAMRGEITVGEVVMYQAYFTQILMAVNQIIVVYPQLAKGYESLVSVSEILSSKEKEEYDGKLRLNQINGNFEFEHVEFQYKDSQKQVLSNFHLQVKAGECIALVGNQEQEKLRY